MPIKINAKKAMRQAKKRALSNKIVRVAYKDAIKDVSKSILAGQTDVKEQLRLAQQRIDKAAKKGVIKKNTASRKLSRLMKKLGKAKATK